MWFLCLNCVVCTSVLCSVALVCRQSLGGGRYGLLEAANNYGNSALLSAVVCFSLLSSFAFKQSNCVFDVFRLCLFVCASARRADTRLLDRRAVEATDG